MGCRHTKTYHELIQTLSLYDEPESGYGYFLNDPQPPGLLRLFSPPLPKKVPYIPGPLTFEIFRGTTGPLLFSMIINGGQAKKKKKRLGWYLESTVEFRDPTGTLVCYKPEPIWDPSRRDINNQPERHPVPQKWKLYGPRPAFQGHESDLIYEDANMYCWGIIANIPIMNEMIYTETGLDGKSTVQPRVLSTDRKQKLEKKCYVGPNEDRVAIIEREMPPSLTLAENVDPIVACAMAHSIFGVWQYEETLY